MANWRGKAVGIFPTDDGSVRSDNPDSLKG